MSQSRLSSLRDLARFSGAEEQAQAGSHDRKPSAESILQTPWINEIIHQVYINYVAF